MVRFPATKAYTAHVLRDLLPQAKIVSAQTDGPRIVFDRKLTVGFHAPMLVSLTPGAIKKFRRTPWRFQQTIERPEPDSLNNFVSTILAAHRQIQSATVTIDRVIFDAGRLAALCPADSTLNHDSSISANSVEDLQPLLVAALWDLPDFICVPTPKPFVLYADHDNWITFFANTKSHLNHVIEPLASRGYKLVQNWQRKL